MHLFRFEFGNNIGLVLITDTFTAELSDNACFRKLLSKALLKVRNIAGNGLFTAHSDDSQPASTSSSAKHLNSLQIVPLRANF